MESETLSMKNTPLLDRELNQLYLLVYGTTLIQLSHTVQGKQGLITTQEWLAWGSRDGSASVPALWPGEQGVFDPFTGEKNRNKARMDLKRQE